MLLYLIEGPDSPILVCNYLLLLCQLCDPALEEGYFLGEDHVPSVAVRALEGGNVTLVGLARIHRLLGQ